MSGFADSINRSQQHIDNIASSLSNYFEKQKAQKLDEEYFNLYSKKQKGPETPLNSRIDLPKRAVTKIQPEPVAPEQSPVSPQPRANIPISDKTDFGANTQAREDQSIQGENNAISVNVLPVDETKNSNIEPKFETPLSAEETLAAMYQDNHDVIKNPRFAEDLERAKTFKALNADSTGKLHNSAWFASEMSKTDDPLKLAALTNGFNQAIALEAKASDAKRADKEDWRLDPSDSRYMVKIVKDSVTGKYTTALDAEGNQIRKQAPGGMRRGTLAEMENRIALEKDPAQKELLQKEYADQLSLALQRDKQTSAAKVGGRQSMIGDMTQFYDYDGKKYARVKSFDENGNPSIDDVLLGEATSTANMKNSSWLPVYNGQIQTGFANPRTKEFIPASAFPAGLNIKTTSAQNNAKYFAGNVEALGVALRDEINKNKSELLSMADRLKGRTAQAVGDSYPQFKQIATLATLTTSLLSQMHVGGRPAAAIKEAFDKLLNPTFDNPDAILSSLDAIEAYVKMVKSGDKTIRLKVTEDGAELVDSESSDKKVMKPLIDYSKKDKPKPKQSSEPTDEEFDKMSIEQLKAYNSGKDWRKVK